MFFPAQIWQRCRGRVYNSRSPCGKRTQQTHSIYLKEEHVIAAMKIGKSLGLELGVLAMLMGTAWVKGVIKLAGL